MKTSSYLLSFPKILSVIIFAATFDDVIPHFLYPVPTNILGIKLENSPIYGILSKGIQSSVFHLNKTLQSGYKSFATFSKFLYAFSKSIFAPVLCFIPPNNNILFPLYIAVLKDILGSSLLIYIPLKSSLLVSTAIKYDVSWYIFMK